MAEEKTVNEMKSLLTSLGLSYPEDADSATLAALLEEARSNPEDADNPAEASNSVEPQTSAEETETHRKGNDGRWYRKPQPPIEQPPLQEQLEISRENQKAFKEAQMVKDFQALAARLYRDGHSKKSIKAAVTEAFSSEDAQ